MSKQLTRIFSILFTVLLLGQIVLPVHAAKRGPVGLKLENSEINGSVLNPDNNILRILDSSVDTTVTIKPSKKTLKKGSSINIEGTVEDGKLEIDLARLGPANLIPKGKYLITATKGKKKITGQFQYNPPTLVVASYKVPVSGDTADKIKSRIRYETVTGAADDTVTDPNLLITAYVIDPLTGAALGASSTQVTITIQADGTVTANPYIELTALDISGIGGNINAAVIVTTNPLLGTVSGVFPFDANNNSSIEIGPISDAAVLATTQTLQQALDATSGNLASVFNFTGLEGNIAGLIGPPIIAADPDSLAAATQAAQDAARAAADAIGAATGTVLDTVIPDATIAANVVLDATVGNAIAIGTSIVDLANPVEFATLQLVDPFTVANLNLVTITGQPGISIADLQETIDAITGIAGLPFDCGTITNGVLDINETTFAEFVNRGNTATTPPGSVLNLTALPPLLSGNVIIGGGALATGAQAGGLTGNISAQQGAFLPPALATVNIVQAPASAAGLAGAFFSPALSVIPLAFAGQIPATSVVPQAGGQLANATAVITTTGTGNGTALPFQPFNAATNGAAFLANFVGTGAAGTPPPINPLAIQAFATQFTSSSPGGNNTFTTAIQAAASAAAIVGAALPPGFIIPTATTFIPPPTGFTTGGGTAFTPPPGGFTPPPTGTPPTGTPPTGTPPTGTPPTGTPPTGTPPPTTPPPTTPPPSTPPPSTPPPGP